MSSVGSSGRPAIRNPRGDLVSQPRACQFCKVRKIKCDKTQPKCSSCTTHGRMCIYKQEKRRPRPSNSLISNIQREKDSLADMLLRLKSTPPEKVLTALQEISVLNGAVRIQPSEEWGKEIPDQEALESLPELPGTEAVQRPSTNNNSTSPRSHSSRSLVRNGFNPPTDGFDPSNHISVDDQGRMGIFGLTSFHHVHDDDSERVLLQNTTERSDIKHQLIANAALQRQREFQVRLLPDIDGVPVEIAQHLLDVHWNRPHHTFLLTYRPALMRDLIHGGPYCSKLLLNAIFASSSKYSGRISLRDNPADPLTAGSRFFRRCDELIAAEMAFSRPSIPTLIAFLLLGSSFVARGEISKGWSYSGFAFRMVYDLGLHIDCLKPKAKAEDIEIQRRVFWGAFICDTMQSLYLGRPMAMHLQDNHCPAEFLDTLEEFDPWVPYSDPSEPSSHVSPGNLAYEHTPVYSVSTFKELCRLSRLMTRIISDFYCSNIDLSLAHINFQAIDAALSEWYAGIPSHLVYASWLQDPLENRPPLPPNIMNLHATYQSLVILLNRPFVSVGHLRSLENSNDMASACWKKCTLAARNITSILASYRKAYTLQGAPYITGYAAYVSCTIHVRNAAIERDKTQGEHLMLLMTSLRALDELSTPNPGATKPVSIVRRLMKKYGIEEPQVPSPVSAVNFPFDSMVLEESMPIAQLFDTFPLGRENLDNFIYTDESPFSDSMSINDALFGFMNAPGL